MMMIKVAPEKAVLFLLLLFTLKAANAQPNLTLFETSHGTQSADYFTCINYYKTLAQQYLTIKIIAGDTTDAGYPLHLVLFSKKKIFTASEWRKNNMVVFMINNGIHPGEPDGIDASMMLLRDMASSKINTPENVVIAIIPVYNIGGCLNRNSVSRVNQDGPDNYGFRGNSQNLDLNRDFIKADSKDAVAFEKLFHQINSDILLDNHVSDGADYQYTMTLLTTQHNKLGYATGEFMHNIFEPALYKSMDEKHWPMTPYVNFEEGNADSGWVAFYDAPRYSSGYAAMFSTISFMAETHMLKPFADRVKSTYALMQTIVEQASLYANDIITKRKQTIEAIQQQQHMPLSWQVDSSKFDRIDFKGYETSTKTSDVTKLPAMFYDHSKPFNKPVKYYNTFKPVETAEKPFAYIIPHGYKNVIDRLKLNEVKTLMLQHDTTLFVEYYIIDDYKSYPTPYEKHYANYDVKTSVHKDSIHFLKGDYIIYTGQPSDRYLVETLEPAGDDSYFNWNFFDAVLQRKEFYSDYRWEDVAAAYLKQHPELEKQLEDKRKTDSAFAASAKQQLYFVYTHSPYSEPAFKRLPVYKLNK